MRCWTLFIRVSATEHGGKAGIVLRDGWTQGFFMVLHTLSTLGTLYSNEVHSVAGGTLDEAIDPDGAAAGCRFSGW